MRKVAFILFMGSIVCSTAEASDSHVSVTQVDKYTQRHEVDVGVGKLVVFMNVRNGGEGSSAYFVPDTPALSWSETSAEIQASGGNAERGQTPDCYIRGEGVANGCWGPTNRQGTTIISDYWHTETRSQEEGRVWVDYTVTYRNRYITEGTTGTTTSTGPREVSRRRK